MRLALERANLLPHQVSYINAHGTSTPAGDSAETRSVKQAFGEHAYHLPISSTKSMTGHLLGGAGALEAAICVQAIRTGVLPPTINLDTPDPTCDLDYIPHHSRPAHLEVVMSNSMGFGGHNTTLILRRL
jgi:3-oxoacyl-[acyl-carrier-protein] synthase II